MHALVTTVLLRLSGLDPLDLDAEPELPDRELGEVEKGIRTGEGDKAGGRGPPPNSPRGVRWRSG
jgi:hypothetical protein